MAAVTRAGPHRGVKDDEVIAHYGRAGEASPGVIRIDQLVEGVVGARSRPGILRTRPTPAASEEHSEAAPPRRGKSAASREVALTSPRYRECWWQAIARDERFHVEML